jgi:ABC-type Mn2+/Zn2+ transport system ATPase subunit
MFKNFSIMVEAGERIAIIGANGAGKTTLLRSIGGETVRPAADSGNVKWAENANVGYMPQDPTEEFATDRTLTDWIGQWTKEGDDDQAVRSILGRLLFGGDDVKKPVKVLSGGEKGRMMYGKLMLGRHNVLLMDEPTNHMDMESIESLNIALEKYAGTLIFVSHDREFVSSLANRILEVKENADRRFPRQLRGIPDQPGHRISHTSKQSRSERDCLQYAIVLFHVPPFNEHHANHRDQSRRVRASTRRSQLHRPRLGAHASDSFSRPAHRPQGTHQAPAERKAGGAGGALLRRRRPAGPGRGNRRLRVRLAGDGALRPRPSGKTLVVAGVRFMGETCEDPEPAQDAC